MPKVIDTRKQRADELLKRLTNGPSIGMPGGKLTQEEYTHHYRLWAETWVLGDLQALIPELRDKK